MVCERVYASQGRFADIVPCYLKDPARFNALVLAFAGAGGLMDRLGIAGEGAARLPIAADWSPPGLGKETYRK